MTEPSQPPSDYNVVLPPVAPGYGAVPEPAKPTEKPKRGKTKVVLLSLLIVLLLGAAGTVTTLWIIDHGAAARELDSARRDLDNARHDAKANKDGWDASEARHRSSLAQLDKVLAQKRADDEARAKNPNLSKCEQAAHSLAQLPKSASDADYDKAYLE